jgi:hypothetical protein
VVGDESLAATEAFRSLSGMHAALLETLSRTGDDPTLRARCAEVGEPLCPGLAAFYDRLPARMGDFA